METTLREDLVDLFGREALDEGDCPSCGRPFFHTGGCEFRLRQTIDDHLDLPRRRILALVAMWRGLPFETPLESARAALAMFEKVGADDAEMWRKVCAQVGARRPAGFERRMPRRAAGIRAAALVAAATSPGLLARLARRQP